MSFKFPLAESTWGEEEINAMHRVIDSGVFTMGDNVNRFEKEFAKYIGSKYCVMVNSGSSANLLMVASLCYREKDPLKRGDEVIVPAVSWGTSYFPLQQYGLKLRFVDVDIETLNYDLISLEKSITSKTRMIMLVNVLGNPNNYPAINKIIEGSNINIIEDNCESMGAEFHGKKSGTFGLMGTFSTFFSHHISTMEGGLIVTDDIELYHLLLTLRAHGWTRNLPNKNKVCKFKSDDEFNESFRFVMPGYNLRPLELEGAIGVEQLKKLPRFISIRRKNAHNFNKIMRNHPDIMIQKESGKSSWFGFSMIVRNKSALDRNTLRKKLLDIGFETRPIVAGDFSKSESMRYIKHDIPFLMKNADYIHSNGLFIGNHNFIMNEHMEKLSAI